MRAFPRLDITSPLDQVSTIPFLLEGDAVEYYHSLTKQVQDDWFELMRVLCQRFDCMSHEPVYLSRMLTSRESEIPQHADYVKEFRNCVLKSKVNISDLQIGYLANSRFVEGLSDDAVLRKYIVEVRMAFWETMQLRKAGGDHREGLHGGQLSTRRGTESVENHSGHRGCCGLQTRACDGSANFNFHNVSFKVGR